MLADRKRGRSRARLVASLLAASALAFGCQLVAGIERVEKAPATGAPPAALTPDPCAHAVPPGEPETDDDRFGELPPFYVAFREVRFARPGDELPGFDLDGVCTCEKRPATAGDGGSTCRIPAGSTDCDDDGGVDNTVGKLFDTFGPFLGGGSPGFIAYNAIREGERNALLRIAGWNGKRNDKEIDVGFMPSQGIYDPSGCGPPDAKARKTFPPAWCGKDKWSRPSGTTTVDSRGEVIPALHGPGFVTDGILNYRPSGRTTYFLGRASLTIGSPMISAKIETLADGRHRMTGIMAGRVSASELLGALGQIEGATDPLTGEPSQDKTLCQLPLFDIVHSTVCDSRDIRSSDTFDRTDSPCDALSAVLSFVGETAAVGEERDADVSPDPCDPAVVEKALYTCPM